MHSVDNKNILTNNTINFTGCKNLESFKNKMYARRLAQIEQNYMNKMRKQMLTKDKYNVIRLNQYLSSIIDKLKSFGIIK